VFKRKASEIFEVFHGVYPDMELELNSSAPRRGAFELTVVDSNGDGKRARFFHIIKKKMIA